jgi:hypothetical protein
VNSYKAGNVPNINNVPLIVCNVIAALMLIVFYYLDSKELILIKQHIPRKYFSIYFTAGFIFVVCLLFCFIFGNKTIISKVANSIAPGKEITIAD